MRKILLGLILLVLNGCAGYSLTSPFVDKEYSNGGLIWSHFSLSNSSPNNIQMVANSNCTRRGFDYANVRQVKAGGMFGSGEFNNYEFTCNSGRQPDKIDEAKETCLRIGFKPGSAEYANCTLELVKKQTQQPANNTIVIQNDGTSSQEMIDRGLGMMSGKRGLDGQLKTPAPTIQIPRTLNCTEMVISRNPYTTKQVCK